MKLFVFNFFGADLLLFRLFEFLSSWITSVRAALHLRIAPNPIHSWSQWLAHAMNGRRVGGVACTGELGLPAVFFLVG